MGRFSHYKIKQKRPLSGADKQRVLRRQTVDKADNVLMRHKGVIIPAMALGLLPQVITGLLSLFGVQLSWLSWVLTLLLLPMTFLGAWRVLLGAWRGRTPSLKADLFAYYAPGELAGAAAFSVVQYGITAAPWGVFWLLERVGVLPSLSRAGHTASYYVTYGPVYFGALLVTFCLVFYLGYRLFPAHCLYVLDKDAPRHPLAAIRAAFAMSRKQLGGMVRYGLTLLRRVAPLLVVYVIVLALSAFLVPSTLVRRAIMLGLAWVMYVLLTPLATLTFIGYYDASLPSFSQAEKQGRRKPSQKEARP